jgi:hypothetical protein
MGGQFAGGLPPFVKVVSNESYDKGENFGQFDLKILGNLTFIGVSLMGFAIIFILLRILPKVKGKSSDHSIPKHSSPTTHLQSTEPNRVYRI